MKRRYSRILAVLAAVTMATVMEDASCYLGNNPDDDPDCFMFCDKSTEKSQTPDVSHAPLPFPLSQASVG